MWTMVVDLPVKLNFLQYPFDPGTVDEILDRKANIWLMWLLL